MGIAFDNAHCQLCGGHHHLYYPGGEEAYRTGKTLRYACPKTGAETNWSTEKWYRVAQIPPENAVVLVDA